MSYDHKLDILEKTVTVMQGELNTVLREMQVTIEGITKTYSTAITVMLRRIEALEEDMKHLKPQVRQDDGGKEL